MLLGVTRLADLDRSVLVRRGRPLAEAVDA
jgi:hypothetical protein